MFQLEETFSLRIQSYSTSNAVIGVRSSIELIVAKSDEPHGELQFLNTVMSLGKWVGHDRDGVFFISQNNAVTQVCFVLTLSDLL